MNEATTTLTRAAPFGRSGYRVLITGASSFIGRHVTEYLVRSGLNVIATYRTPSEFLHRLRVSAANLTLSQIDISKKEDFSTLPSSISAVIHIAGVYAEAGIPLEDMLATNVIGTRNVQRYALEAGAERLIYTSSIMVHGCIEVAVVDHKTPVIDPGTYGASKFLGERMLESTADRLPAVALRLPGVLGLGAHRAWLPTLLDRLSKGHDVEIYSPDAPFNNAADVNDIAEFIRHLLLDQKWDEFKAMPIAAGGMMLVREVVARMCAALDTTSKVVLIDAPTQPFTISSDSANALGYRPASIETIIDQYLEVAAPSLRL